MNVFTLASLILSLSSAGQGHDMKPEGAMGSVGFLAGDWKGTQTFYVGDGNTMVGQATDHAEYAVGGRFIEERLSTTLTNRPPTDTRHMLGFDKKTGKYVAYWFNDTSSTAMELSGTLEESKLVLATKPGGPRSLRFTYDGSKDGELSLTFEMEVEGKWQVQFKSVYHKETVVLHDATKNI